jgi:hypothetical protein
MAGQRPAMATSRPEAAPTKKITSTSKYFKGRVLLLLVPGIFTPALEKIVLDFEKIEYLADGLVDDVGYRSGVVVK